jgi:hypothetical protein
MAKKLYRFFTFTIPAGLRSLVNQNAELLKIVQDSVFVALQETLGTAYNNELAKKASRKGLKREKDLKLKTGMPSWISFLHCGSLY